MQNHSSAILDPRNSSHFVTPVVLLATRIFALLWIFVFGCWSLSIHGGSWFRFLTNLSWVGLFIFFSLAVTASVYRHQQPSRAFQLSFDAFFATASTIPWIVTLIFWIFLNSQFRNQSTDLGRFMSFNPHVLNVFFVMVESILSRNPLHSHGYLWPLLALCLYLNLSLILRYAYGIAWPYSFLSSMLETGALLTITILFFASIGVVILYMIAAKWASVRDHFFAVVEETDLEDRWVKDDESRDSF